MRNEGWAATAAVASAAAPSAFAIMGWKRRYESGSRNSTKMLRPTCDRRLHLANNKVSARTDEDEQAEKSGKGPHRGK